MKKLTILLLTAACTLTVISNSFSMLIPKSFRTKKLRPFCTKTNSHDHPLIFKEGELNISTKDNRDLLREIIEQNKENNELLRIIIQQNFLNSDHLYMYDGNPRTTLERCHTVNSDQNLRLYYFYNNLARQYNIKIRPHE